MNCNKTKQNKTKQNETKNNVKKVYEWNGMGED